jgi:hypothetical protein
LNIAADISDADKPSQGVTRSGGDPPSEFEGNWKLLIGYQPRVSLRPANSINQSCEVRGDIRVEGRVVFGRVAVIILAIECFITAGEIIRALGMNKVDLAEVGPYDTRLENDICSRLDC